MIDGWTVRRGVALRVTGERVLLQDGGWYGLHPDGSRWKSDGARPRAIWWRSVDAAIESIDDRLRRERETASAEPLQIRIEPSRVPCRCCESCARLRDDEQRRTMLYAGGNKHAPCRFCGTPTAGMLVWAGRRGAS